MLAFGLINVFAIMAQFIAFNTLVIIALLWLVGYDRYAHKRFF